MKKLLMTLLPLLAAAACTPAGTGTGQLVHTTSGTQPVAFNWRADDSTTGSLTAALPGGKLYKGRYVQITERISGTALTPLWEGWDEGWTSWPDVDPNGNTDFGRHYTHRVVANLTSPDGGRMRCRFDLNSRANGMSGGGKGECQLLSGGVIEAVFPSD